MGLAITHGCWRGPYSYFGEFREALARMLGYESLEAYWAVTLAPPSSAFGIWGKFAPGDPIDYLLCHSDCDGYMEPEHCAVLADRLVQLLPSMTEWRDEMHRLISGLRRAAAAGERVLFR